MDPFSDFSDQQFNPKSFDEFPSETANDPFGSDPFSDNFQIPSYRTGQETTDFATDSLFSDTFDAFKISANRSLEPSRWPDYADKRRSSKEIQSFSIANSQTSASTEAFNDISASFCAPWTTTAFEDDSGPFNAVGESADNSKHVVAPPDSTIDSGLDTVLFSWTVPPDWRSNDANLELTGKSSEQTVNVFNGESAHRNSRTTAQTETFEDGSLSFAFGQSFSNPDDDFSSSERCFGVADGNIDVFLCGHSSAAESSGVTIGDAWIDDFGIDKGQRIGSLHDSSSAFLQSSTHLSSNRTSSQKTTIQESTLGTTTTTTTETLLSSSSDITTSFWQNSSLHSSTANGSSVTSASDNWQQHLQGGPSTITGNFSSGSTESRHTAEHLHAGTEGSLRNQHRTTRVSPTGDSAWSEKSLKRETIIRDSANGLSFGENSLEEHLSKQFEKQISQRGSPVKCLNENPTDVERSLEEAQDQRDAEPPEIPPLPVGGLPPIVRAPGSEEENEEEEEQQVESKFETSSKPSLASYFPGKGSEKERNGNDKEQWEDVEISRGGVQAFANEKSFSEFPSKAQTDQSQVESKKTAAPSAQSLPRRSGLPNGQLPQGTGSYEQGDLDRCGGEREQVGTSSKVKRKDRDLADAAAPVVASASSIAGDDEMPPASFLQKLLNKFRQMERESARSQASPLKAKSAPATPIRRPISQEEDDDSERNQAASAGADRRPNDAAPGYATAPTAAAADESAAAAEAADEFPQKGLAKNLLAQWRMLEAQELRAREREEQRRKVSVTTRSHSLSRIEETQRMLYEGGKSVTTTAMRGQGGGGGGDDSDSFTESSLMTASDDGQGLLLSSLAGVIGVTGAVGSVEGAYDDEYLPPPLMTKYVLAKFRDLEAESKIIAGIQPKLKKEEKHDKNFKWEVKESLPLIRGGLIVHGDLPRGKSSDVARHLERKRSDSEPPPATTTTTTHGTNDNSCEEDEKEEEEDEEKEDTATGRDGELPPPEMTKALLAHFRSIEETYNGMIEVNPKRLESRSKGPSSRSEGGGGGGQQRSEGDPGSAAAREQQQQLDTLPQSLETSFDLGEVASGTSLSVDEFPEQGTTRSLLAKFQLMQSNP